MADRSFAAAVGDPGPIAPVDGLHLEFPRAFHEEFANATSKGFIRHARNKDGKPALFFDQQDIINLSDPLRLALIGKFQFAQPGMEALRNWASSLGCSSRPKIGILDGRHVLITFASEQDYSYVFSIINPKVEGKQMKLLKWSPLYFTNVESPIAPVWVKLPGLLIHYFNKQVLFSIAAIFGKPLRLDHATSNLTRPSQARILVERDVTLVAPEEIWIGDDETGYWQKVQLEFVP